MSTFTHALPDIDLSRLPASLGRFGFNSKRPYCEMRDSDAEGAIAEVRLAMQFLRLFACPMKDRPISSYSLKHVIERGLSEVMYDEESGCRQYMPNGAAIAAAILLGHRVARPPSLRTTANAAIFVSVLRFNEDGCMTREWRSSAVAAWRAAGAER